VAEPCKVIAEDREAVYRYTNKSNYVAVVSNGTAVLGLGNIGPEASMPVMEGKCVLFKSLAGIDAFPICINAKTSDEIVGIVAALDPTFGGINLEDIAAPICFAAESKLKEKMNIPVFHDDQHGTAIVVLSGLTNALQVVGKTIGGVRAVINGSGAAGIAIGKILLDAGIGDLVMCDKAGILDAKDTALNPYMIDMAEKTNKSGLKGALADAMKGADVFIGVSAPNVVSQDMVRSMNQDAIVFALANPVMEINPEAAKAAGARIVATGSSNYPNQVNNLLAFPGVLRGALDVRARDINEAMKQAAARAIAKIAAADLREDRVIPNPFNLRVVPAVAQAVAQAAIDSGVARNQTTAQEVYRRAYAWILPEL
jgi:malate dehydrogenase (oxaloacetate-decarboxylating)